MTTSAHVEAVGEVVLVTGGNGFVAGWCMIDLLERGHTVRATVRDRSHGSAVRTAVDAAGRAAIA